MSSRRLFVLGLTCFLFSSGCAAILDGSPSAQLEQVAICTFNIKFLGHYKTIDRDDEGLARVLEEFDIIVIQELVAPPTDVIYPNGDTDPADPEAREFFDAMEANGFEYWLSEEDTGTSDSIHSAGTGTEWWVAFYKPDIVEKATDLPNGFLADDRSNHDDYERVPYAFSFRTLNGALDFALVSVHLRPGNSSADAARREHEIEAIADWIGEMDASEQDFIVLGDMNIKDCVELESFTPEGFASLNALCVATNTNPDNPRPYDHVLYRADRTCEIDTKYGLHVIDLVDVMEDFWCSEEPYPGTPYDHDTFSMYYSDHNPVHFRLQTALSDDE